MEVYLYFTDELVKQFDKFLDLIAKDEPKLDFYPLRFYLKIEDYFKKPLRIIRDHSICINGRERESFNEMLKGFFADKYLDTLIFDFGQSVDFKYGRRSIVPSFCVF